jgi:hypothetical protein
MKRALVYAALVVVGATACARILGIRPPAPRPFDHRVHVVEGISCVRCHAGIETAGDDGPLHLPDTELCLECHSPPHEPGPCLSCHGMPYTASDLTQARKHLRFSHERHMEPLKGNCVRCHSGVAVQGAPLTAKMGTCLGCHQHKDQFKIRECEACHVDLPAELTRPESHLVHDGDFLREHGVRAASAGDLCASCHKQSFCLECHGATAPTLPSRMRFDDPMRAGMHRAGFLARHAEESRAQPGMCSTCHTEQSCAGCHVERGVAAGGDVRFGNPHPPGWVGIGSAGNEHGRAARRDPASCASCHGGAGEMLCVSCHKVGGVGGSPHPPGWSSRKGYADQPCRLCHLSTAF